MYFNPGYFAIFVSRLKGEIKYAQPS